MRLSLLLSAGLLIMASMPMTSDAQNYPVKTIRLVTAEAGGSTDVAARLIAQGLGASLGQQAIVDNRPSSVVGELVAKSAPDGYTLLVIGSAFVIGPLLTKTAYDPLRDFTPISLTSSSPNVLVVHPALPVKSVRDLIALAKARPGELNYGSGPNGSSPHLAAELFNSMAKVNIVRVPYKGGGPAVNALIAGEVHMMISPAGSVSIHVKSGRLKPLAVTSAHPSSLLPGLPTVAESGLPGHESSSIVGMLAPAATSDAIATKLSQEVMRTLNRPDVKEKFVSAGVEALGSSPEQLATIMKTEVAKWAKVIKDAGIKGE